MQKRLVLQAKDHLEQIGYLQEVHRTYFGVYTNDLLRLSLLSGDPVQFQRDTQKYWTAKALKSAWVKKDTKLRHVPKMPEKHRFIIPAVKSKPLPKGKGFFIGRA